MPFEHLLLFEFDDLVALEDELIHFVNLVVLLKPLLPLVF